ncbi:MAG: hypothetical protein Q8O67_03065 [Deltaproteobacteria bacterium]|nr:hypothetical protein [Deltaproteobacteria bacterium]
MFIARASRVAVRSLVAAGLVCVLATTGCLRVFGVDPIPNVRPVAVAEEAVVVVAAGSSVVLDGTLSSDKEKDPLTFFWTQVDNGAGRVPITDGTTAVASFTAPKFPGELLFQLVVNDGFVESLPFIVQVTVEIPDNLRPEALVVDAQIAVLTGQTVALDASPSRDPENAELTFRWQQVESDDEIVNPEPADGPVATFTAPDVATRLFFQIIVNDGVQDSAPFVVRVDVGDPPNDPPEAAALAEIIVASFGEQVVLDGSLSSDADGDPLTFTWTRVEGEGPPVNLLTPNEAIATFTAPTVDTQLFFQLVVSDGRALSLPFVVRVDVGSPANFVPVAEATSELIVAAFGEQVVLDGSLSSDDDGDTLTFLWTAIEGDGDPVNLVDAATAVASFTAPDVPGRLFFQLVVSDGLATSLPFVVRVDVASPPNVLPEAVVADDAIEVFVGESVVLDGGDSSDADLDELTFTWEQIAAEEEPVNLIDADAAVASFTAPNVPVRLFFRLTVGDGTGFSTPVVVRVDVTEPPDLPPDVVLVAAELGVTINQTVVMDASGSADPEGRPLTFRWEQVVDDVGVPVNVNGSLTAVASFTAPDTATRLFFRLFVSDGTNEAPPAVVRVDVTAPPPNLPPVALAGSDTTLVQSGSTVNLIGAPSSDADGTIVAFKWSLIAGPQNGLAIFTPSTADIADPQVQVIGRGSYFLGLVVTDDDGDTSNVATVRVDAINNVPTASAGPNGTGVNGTQITAIGTAVDFDGDALSFIWTLAESPPGGAVSLVDPDKAAVKFTPSKKTAVSDPALCGPNQCYVLQLVVSDGRDFSITTKATFTSTNRAPVADAGPDTDVVSTIVLDGSGSSDPDNDDITSFTWTQVLGPQLPGGPVFTGESLTLAATEAALYQFELVVSDGIESSAPDRVVVLVGDVNEAPVISCATSRFRAPDGLQGDLSCSVTDLNNDVVATTWTRTAGSALFPATLDGATPAFLGPSYAALIAGPEGNGAEYEITATDGTDDAVPVQVEVFGVPGVGFVVVDTGPGSAVTADCGTTVKPCATLAAALALVDPDANNIGDGRDLVLTTSTFTFLQARIPGGTSLFGGRDPFTFDVVGATELLHSGGVMTQSGFVQFTSTAQDAQVERVNVRFARGPNDGSFNAVECASCSLTVRDVAIVAEGATNLAALAASGTAIVDVARSRLEVSGTRDNQEALLVLGGSVTAADSDLFATVSNGSGRNGGVRLVSGTAFIDRSRLFVTGGFSFNNTNVIRVEGGVMQATNNFVFLGNTGDGSAISQAGGAGSFLFNTIVAPGGLANTFAFELNANVALMGNIIAGFPAAILFNTVQSRGSSIYGNVFDNVGVEFNCAGLGTNDNVNAAPPASATSCNGSTQAWTDNVVTSCPLLNSATGELHLNAGLTNPCIGTGLADSPAGRAPDVDIDAQTRSAPFSVGADQ